MFYVKTTGSPANSITEFYTAIVSGDYSRACTYLADYDELGLDNIPDTDEGQLILEALKTSYSYSLIGQPVVDKLSANQLVSFTYLDISQVESETASAENKRRIIDFLVGVAYANGGSLKPVANLTYIITPYNVGFIGEDLVGELESNGVIM